MTKLTEQWSHVRRVLEEVLERQDGERGAYLDEACAGLPDVRAEVEALLRADAADDEELPALPPEDGVRAWLDARVSRALAGTRIGSCRLLRVLASGGMGTVYEAEQDNPPRVVAIKMLRLGATSADALRRFQAEVAALASLRHPGIAQVYEAGVHRETVAGRAVEVPYFVLEHVAEASTLLEFATAKGLGRDARVGLFLAVCDAVQHGHDRGIVHRDLKPSNLLVDGEGRVKVIDFGIARVLPTEGLGGTGTRSGELLGTLRYMSPEQLAGVAAVGPPCDVHALGVVLYELLCDASPWPAVGGGLVEAVRALQEEPPVPPRRAAPDLASDLDWILRKALERDPGRRYPNAGALGRDLRRYLGHHPVEAGPPGAWYRLCKFGRRHRVAMAAGTLVGIGFLAGVVGVTYGYVTADRQRRAAEIKAEEAAAMFEFLQNTLIAADPWHGGGDVPVRKVVEQAGSHIDQVFPERPQVAGMLHGTIGTVMQGMGRLEEAERHYRRAVELLAIPTETADPRKSVLARKRLAMVLGDLGRHDEGAPLLEQAARDAERLLGRNDDLTLATLDLHATMLVALGRAEEAVTILEGVLARAERLVDPASKAVIAHRNNLVAALSAAGRRAEAVESAGRNVEAMVEGYGESHPDTLVAMQNQAALLQLTGRSVESEQVTRRVLDHYAPILPETHPHVVLGHLWLAEAVAAQGRHGEAQAIYRAAFAAGRQTLGATHSRVLRLQKGLAASLLATGGRDEAAALLRDLMRLVDASTDVRASDLRGEVAALLDQATGASRD